MLHVFIDTSVLLRFYAYSDDALAEIEKLSALAKTRRLTLLVTRQVVEERARNRDREINESLKRLDQQAMPLQIPRFAAHHSEATELGEAIKLARAAKDKLLAAIRKEMDGDGLRADRTIQELFSATKVLETSSASLTLANQRRAMGNPPGKKDSLGDQINWEILLEKVPDGTDLHIVARDGDFGGTALNGAANFYLVEEWRAKKQASLRLYAGLGAFTREHFPDIKAPIDAVKVSAIADLVASTSFQNTHRQIELLNGILDELTPADALTILTAFVDNSQIRDIQSDDDVQSFFGRLYTKHWTSVPTELDKRLMAAEQEDLTIFLPF